MYVANLLFCEDINYSLLAMHISYSINGYSLSKI